MIWWLAGCIGVAPLPEAGVLAPCPWTPNCVSSQLEVSAGGFVEPLVLHGPADDASARLLRVVLAVPGAGQALVVGDRIRVEFHTPSGLFTDDVDLWVDRAHGVIHVRSSSRVGLGDGGVNRRRVEAIRAAWELDRQR